MEFPYSFRQFFFFQFKISHQVLRNKKKNPLIHIFIDRHNLFWKRGLNQEFYISLMKKPHLIMIVFSIKFLVMNFSIRNGSCYILRGQNFLAEHQQIPTHDYYSSLFYCISHWNIIKKAFAINCNSVWHKHVLFLLFITQLP